jgi:tetratricopeptide (TPR) repeat protein
MKRAAPFLVNFFVIFSAAVAQVFAQARDGGVSDVRSAQELMVRQRYAEASLLVNSVLKKNPGDIDALYTLVAIEQTRVLDYESYGVDGARFTFLADSVLTVLDRRQAALRGGDSLRCLFYRASVVGGASLMLAKRGAWIEGAKNAMASLGMYKQLKKADPAHPGADLGLGIYDYYFGTTLKWIPFVSSGSVERGLAASERALRAPFPFDHAAKSSYCWMLIDREQYKKADSLAHSVLLEIPTNTIFLRIRALIALWSGSYDDALFLGGKLRGLSEARTPVNWSDLITSYYIITSAHENLGQRAEAEKAAEKGLSLPMPEEFRNMPNVKEHIKYLNGVKRKGGKKK